MKDEKILFCGNPNARGTKEFAESLRLKYSVTTVDKPEDVVNILKHAHFDLVLLYLDDEKQGYEYQINLLQNILAVDENISVVFAVAHRDIQAMVRIAQSGAFYYWVGDPPDIEQGLKLVDEKMEIHRDIFKKEPSEKAPFGIVGRSAAIRRVLALINKVKDTDTNVIITGESGTGKELVAHALHFGGKRRSGPFEVVNCGAIPANLMESELFGHAKGAFTGAYQARKGKFELAHGGTLFLDEIGELELPLQAKLLRVLEDFKVEPIGSGTSINVDVRIITATNRDLEKMTEEGLFREDLLFRLNVINIHLPPLRERKEDIPVLVKHFLNRYSEKFSIPIEGIDSKALEALENYDWPGNIRELQNVIQRLVILSEGRQIKLSDLPKSLVKANRKSFAENNGSSLVPVYIGDTLEEAEKRIILSTLRYYNDNKTRAAEVLGITDRTLRNKLKIYLNQ
ncbi:sigma-54 dependent transcriptional regulator [Thermosyntropha sp.]|uniref:sigma-54-dependent transcriptional regulator n=1 Tax=Thermosyntropha sp. TaxID=2740820 RepID=UPI0025D9B1B7|nr:sigma-54 dependent transcriptional regulator [Thermosyntropha sp.]MBO8159270.1 sigma-54-dependent Fis family transcriptional regulator [Thermosyntropha sp.]